MKCGSCGGELAGVHPVCPFCGSRQETDLRTVNARNLGAAQAMACPRCDDILEMLRLETADGAREMEVERCPRCAGIFFNPGELETFLHDEVVSTVWLDWDRMEALRPGEDDGRDTVSTGRHYVRCPLCCELMSSRNFGRRSGVLVDICRHHGIWLDGGELRTIAEWWHAGGRHVHQANEAALAGEVIRTALPRMAPKKLIEGETSWDSTLPSLTLDALLRAIAAFFGR